jgi:hypothetical protein
VNDSLGKGLKIKGVNDPVTKVTLFVTICICNQKYSAPGHRCHHKTGPAAAAAEDNDCKAVMIDK